MEDYLKFTKASQTKLSSYQNVHVVRGNEACDLDSAVSAIVYAYFLHKTLTEKDRLVVPVLNIPRQKFVLRTETVFFLNQQGISADMLTFRDDLDLSHLNTCDKLTLTLVDHNVLPVKDAALETAVTTVIDHRPRQRPEDEKVRVVMDTVGSCSTLIAEELLLNGDSFVMEHQVAVLLYGTIVVDTINQSPAAGKTTPRDTAAIQTLQGWLPEINGADLYKQLQAAKFDMAGLSTVDIFEKDLKIVTGSCCTVAMASVSMDMPEFLGRDNFVRDYQDFLHDQEASILVVMTLCEHIPGEPCRRIAVCSPDRNMLLQLASTLLNSSDPDLELTELSSPVLHDGLRCYNQGNVKASRKQVLPLVTIFSNIPSEMDSHRVQNTFTGNTGVANNPGSANNPDSANNPVSSNNPYSGNYPGSANYPGSGNNPSSANNPGIHSNAGLIQNCSNNVDFHQTDENSHVIPTLNFVNLDDDLGDLNEADILESPRTPDIMVNNINGRSGNSSTNVSRPGSGFPSVPATPPNSYRDGIGFGFMSKEQSLPSFNSSEMIRKIQEKKDMLAACSGNPSRSGSEGNSVPYTPQNSLIEFGFDAYVKEQNLPSFNSSDMVQKIKQKRSSMGDNSDFSQGGELLIPQSSRPSDFVPFTPQNSYRENHFSMYMDQSVDPCELSSHLEAIRGLTEEVRCQSPEVVTSSHNIIQSNFFMDGASGATNVDTSFTMNTLPEWNDLSFRLGQGHGNATGRRESDECEVNVVAMEIARAMLKDDENDETSSNSITEDDASRDDDTGDQGNRANQGQGHSDDHGGNTDQSQNNPPRNDLQGSRGKGSCEEVVFKELVYALAEQMIGNALDNFPNMANPIMAKSIMAILHQPSMGDGSSHLLEITLEKGLKHPVQLTKTPSNTSITVETDYLSRIDPLHGNIDLSTSGGREVIESASFRKISGEQNSDGTTGYGVAQDFVAHGANGLSKTSWTCGPIEEMSSVNMCVAESFSDLPKNVLRENNSQVSGAPKNFESQEEKYCAEECFCVSPACANSSVNLRHRNEANLGIVSPHNGDISISAHSTVDEYASQLVSRMLANAIAALMQGYSSGVNITIHRPQDPEQKFESHSAGFTEIHESELLTDRGSTDIEALPPGGITCPLSPPDGASSDSSDSCSTTTEGSYRLMVTPDTENVEIEPDRHVQERLTSNVEVLPCDVNDKNVSRKRVRGLSTEEIEKWNDESEIAIDLTETETGKSDGQPLLAKYREENLSHSRNEIENSHDKVPDMQDNHDLIDSRNSAPEVSQSVAKVTVLASVCDTKGNNSSQICDVRTLQGDNYHGAKLDSSSAVCDRIENSTVPKNTADNTSSSDTHSGSHVEKRDNSDSNLKKKGDNSAKTEDRQLPKNFQDGISLVKDIAESSNPRNSEAWKQENRFQGKPSVSMTTANNNKDRLHDIEFSEEWQDDDIPGMPPAEVDDDDDDSSESSGSRSRHSSDSSQDEGPVRPSNLTDLQKKRKMGANSDNILTEDNGGDLDPALLGELEWENDTPIKSPAVPIPQYTAEEERRDAKHWRLIEISGREQKIDLMVIEPFKRVLSHGGYYGDGLNAIIVFSGCFLPDRSRTDYHYVMDHLFLYVVSTLERLVAEDYMIVYFHGATPRRQMPGFSWLKKCYQMIDRRLRKNLKGLLLVHPTLWLKTIVIMTRPFISSKFSSKLRFVRSIQELAGLVPMEYVYVPDHVQKYDDKLTKHSSQASTSTPPLPTLEPSP